MEHTVLLFLYFFFIFFFIFSVTIQIPFSLYEIPEKPLIHASMIRDFSFISHGSESLLYTYKFLYSNNFSS